MGLEQFDTVLAFTALMLTLSLLITIVVQMVVALMGLRGMNLRWGVEQVLLQLDPALGLQALAGKLTNAVLTHPVLAHTARRSATAIRITELIDVLEDLANNPARGNGLEPRERDALAAALRATIPAVSVGDVSRAAVLVDAVLKIFPAADASLRNAVAAALTGKRQVELEIERWFNTAMDRCAERFVLHTRWITAGAALLMCAFLHIDALRIFGQLSSSKELRTQFIARGQSLLDRGTEIDALTQPSGQGARALASDAIGKMQQDAALPATLTTALANAPSGLTTRRQGRDWLDLNVSEADRARAAQAFGEYFDALSREQLVALGAAFQRTQSLVEDTQLTIVPKPIPWIWEYDLRHFLGVLISILLLSLGAPFWFNLLKQLTALRPVLAKKVDADAALSTG